MQGGDLELRGSTGQTALEVAEAVYKALEYAKLKALRDGNMEVYNSLKADVKEGACLTERCLGTRQCMSILSAGHASLHPCTCVHPHFKDRPEREGKNMLRSEAETLKPHAATRMHARTHTRMHAHTCTYTYARTQACTHAQMHAHKHKRMHAVMHVRLAVLFCVS